MQNYEFLTTMHLHCPHLGAFEINMLVIFKALKQFKSLHISWRGRFANKGYLFWHPPPIQKGGVSTETWVNLDLKARPRSQGSMQEPTLYVFTLSCEW